MRQGDTDSTRVYFRSSTRVFNLNGSWYFATREGDQGPFVTRDRAEVEALRYTSERETLYGFQASRDAGDAVRRAARRTLSVLPMEETTPRHGIVTLDSD
jgi:hypothetical protein